ncbi:hypothetical protein N7540_008610 [Penicillium herquei]|nr:hypothetical protein N7540_008610 [Penicillium herquei]
MVVKTTYALTLFTAVSLAAPMQKGGSGGSENFIGAGTANGQVNDVVKGLFKNLTPRDGDDGGSSKHGNLINNIPLLGPLLGSSNNQEKRSFTGDLANFPLLGELFGGGQNHGQNAGQNYGQNAGQNYKQNYGQNYGQNAGQNAGQNEGENYGQNYGQNDGQNDGENYGQNYLQNFGQNHKRDLEGDLSGLPIIGSLFGGDDKGDKDGKNDKDTKDSKDNKDNKDSDDNDDKSPAEGKKLDSRQFEGVWTLIHGLTAGAPTTQSHRRDFESLNDAIPESGHGDGAFRDDSLPDDFGDLSASTFRTGMEVTGDVVPLPVLTRDMSDDEAKKPGQEAQTQDAQSGKEDKESKPAKPSKSNNPLAELASESGLGQLFGNAHHGVGLIPINGRRDISSIEPRAAPIQGSTLTDVLLQGGALGKISKALAPQPAGPPGKSDPTKIGDGSGMAPPGAPGSPPGSAAAGPHHGPGYIAEHKKQN